MSGVEGIVDVLSVDEEGVLKQPGRARLGIAGGGSRSSE